MFSAPRVVVVVIVLFELFVPVTTSAQVNFEKNGYYLSLGDSVRAVYPTATSTQVTNTSLRSRRAFSVGSADSKKSSRASMRLVLAASTIWPWLAMSHSGQRATYTSSSRSMMAVSCRVDFMAR